MLAIEALGSDCFKLLAYVSLQKQVMVVPWYCHGRVQCWLACRLQSSWNRVNAKLDCSVKLTQ